ncbi:hypothetical protein GWI33_019361 [Rhynchophorus ferrugineus]|uniref:Odorant receptor n=1 Tax=Rhynchophorus ferrugineus TaxID=354439 RepID=A0A834HUX2_RHYFE|nr:hypothetical protein GWI33_019361 [Rhynchophorus ferrugineus]
MYEPKKDDMFYMTVKFLRLLYLYPSDSQQRHLGRYYFLSGLIRFVSSFVLLECIIHTTMSIKNNNYFDLTEDIVGITGLTNSMILCVKFQVYAKEWSQLFKDLADTSKFGEPKELRKISIKMNLYSFLYSAYCVVGVSIYALVKMLEKGNCEKLNKEKNIQNICGIVAPFWWPHNNINTLFKSLIIFYQVYSIGVYVPPSATICFLPWECAKILSVKIDHLKTLFLHVFDCEDLAQKKKRLQFCILYHNEILRLAEETRERTRINVGQLSIVGAIVMSCIGNQMLKQYSVGALIHLAGYLVAVYFICEAGQIIKNDTESVSDSIWSSRWHTDLKLSKDLKIVIQRSQKPVTLTSYLLGDFDYGLLIVIIKTTYSYLTLLTR